MSSAALSRPPADAVVIAASGLFDLAWYLEQNPVVRAAGVDGLTHYVERGAAEGCNPNRLFASAWYLEQNPDVRAAGMNPLVHYLRHGAGEGRAPGPAFDGNWYLANNPDVAAAGINPLAHYLRHGAAEQREIRPLPRSGAEFDAGPPASNPELELIAASGLFDANRYLEEYPCLRAAGLNLVLHYLEHGAGEGRDPNPLFDGAWYLAQNPDVRAAGMNPLAHYLRHGAGEGRAPGPDFDGKWYLANNPDVATTGIGPLEHFLRDGAKEGRAGVPPAEAAAPRHGADIPAAFDPIYYCERYPDIAQAAVSPLDHYLTSGEREGRRPVSLASRLAFDRSRLDGRRETVLLISHEASRTGAPILAWNIATRLRDKYNVVALLLAGGELVDDFRACCAAVIGPLTLADREPLEAKYLVERLLASYSIAYAIANSAESRQFVPALAKACVPVVSLIHEFSSYTRPKEELGEALKWSAQIVFSSDLTAESAACEHPVLSERTIHILPQGRCELPARPNARRNEIHCSLTEVLRPKGYEDAFVVLGAGQVSIRKGLEVFLSCAAALPRSQTKRPIRFVWIGDGYDAVNDLSYSVYLYEQIARCGLQEIVSIVAAVDDLAPAYAMSDVFFLSSRLDAMPNVAIDAAFSGLPILCFERSTGMASLLAAQPSLRCCVLPYLDAQAAACAIARFAEDEEARKRVGAATRRFAETTFDMANYVRRLDELGREAVDSARRQKQAL